MNLGYQNFNVASLQKEAEMKVSFLRKLNNMTERVKVYADYFNTK